MLSHLTMYADDTHACWDLASSADLRFMSLCVRRIYEVYARFGMKLNPQKSVFISGLIGTQGRQWIRQKCRGNFGSGSINFGSPLGPSWIPLRKHFGYLGVIASYGNFEDLTLKFRMRAATVARQRLLRILHSSKYLSLLQRLELYTTCIRTSTLYAVAVVGVTKTGARQLCSFEAKHIRAIAKAPSHVYKEPTTALLLRLGYNTPVDAILRYLQKIPQNRRGETVPGILMPFYVFGMFLLPCALVSRQHPTRFRRFPAPYVESTLADCRPCASTAPKCMQMRSPSAPTLRLLDGLLIYSSTVLMACPPCRHCHLKLTTWNNFRRHIQRSCPALHSGARDGTFSAPVPSLEDTPKLADTSSAGPQICPTRTEALGPAWPSAAGSQSTSEGPVLYRPQIQCLLQTDAS